MALHCECSFRLTSAASFLRVFLETLSLVCFFCVMGAFVPLTLALSPAPLLAPQQAPPRGSLLAFSLAELSDDERGFFCFSVVLLIAALNSRASLSAWADEVSEIDSAMPTEISPDSQLESLVCKKQSKFTLEEKWGISLITDVIPEL